VIKSFKEDKDEEEEHLAPVDSVALPVIDSVPSAEETEPFETDESSNTPPPPISPQTIVPLSMTRLRGARMTVRPQTSLSASTKASIVEYAYAPTPPSPLPLTSYSSPLPHIPAPSLLVPSPSLPIPSPPLHVPLPPLLLPSVNCRSDIPKVDMSYWKRLCLTALAFRFEFGESLVASAARQTGLDLTHEEVNKRVTDLASTQRIEWQRQEAGDMVTRAFGRIHALEARDLARPDDLEDTSSINKSSGNGDDSHDSGSGRRRTEHTTRECTYRDFLKFQPLNFKGTEGVIGLTQWFEKMESLFHISNCTVACQIKFATCTLLGSALMWWNSHVKIVGHDAPYEIPCKTLMKMMTAKYCPRSEIKKLEIKIWNLKVKGTNVVSYTQRFQELALMCGRMFPKESNKVEKYVGGLTDMIQGSVMASKPRTLQDAIEFVNDLMDQKIPRAYTAGLSEKREYGGSLPLCTKCNYHHNGQCAPKCNNYNKVGHLARDCRSPAATTNNQRVPKAIQRVVTCFECRFQGHYKKDCPKLKNKNRGNQAGNGKAQVKAYAMGNSGTNPDSNVVTGMFLLNNRYASILFDTGADRSFVSTSFSSLIDIFPTALDHDYDVKLADKKIIGVNTII
ncbi:reverse transcriptase domain-containing protein, partial [Tanacetum coccineum]